MDWDQTARREGDGGAEQVGDTTLNTYKCSSGEIFLVHQCFQIAEKKP